MVVFNHRRVINFEFTATHDARIGYVAPSLLLSYLLSMYKIPYKTCLVLETDGLTRKKHEERAT